MWEMRKTHPLNIKSETLVEHLTVFEKFCMGETSMTPDQFMTLNKELSMGVVMHVGRHHVRKESDGEHLIWIDPNQRVHDLGHVENIDILHECPGFNKIRTLACSKESYQTEVIPVPQSRHNMTCVKLEDGTQGIGPDFKIAMRNAVLKKQLKADFNKAKGRSLWELFTGGRA